MLDRPNEVFNKLSDVSTHGTERGVFVTEDFWLIVVTGGNADEAKVDDFERARREDSEGCPASDAQEILI